MGASSRNITLKVLSFIHFKKSAVKNGRNKSCYTHKNALNNKKAVNSIVCPSSYEDIIFDGPFLGRRMLKGSSYCTRIIKCRIAVHNCTIRHFPRTNYGIHVSAWATCEG